MAQNANANIVTFAGEVEVTNPNGIKLKNHEQWFNYSQYGYGGGKYQPNKPEPTPGQQVIVQVKNDRFLHSLQFGTPGTPVATPAPSNGAVRAPAPVVMNDTNVVTVNNQDRLIQVTIDTRQTLLKTLAVAQPGLFSLEKLDELTEIVRNLESFVLASLQDKASSDNEDEVIDIPEDELLEEDL